MEEKNAEMAHSEGKLVRVEKSADKKCPQCGAAMVFEPESQKFHCDFCDHREELENPVDSAEKAEEIVFSEDIENSADCDWGLKNKVVHCKTCGADVVCDVLTSADRCPYCDSVQVQVLDDTKVMAPGGVVPFKISEKEGRGKVQAWAKKLWMVPNEFTKQCQAGRMTGIYLPYWSFDCKINVSYSAEYGIDDVRESSSGNTKVKTHWHKYNGHLSFVWDDKLTPATNRHPKELLEQMSDKFGDTNEAVKYNPEYMAGFLAERYSIPLQTAWKGMEKQLNEAIKQEIEETLMSEFDADRVSIKQYNYKLSCHSFKYLLLPLWVTSFKQHNKNYNIFINGSTGEVTGDHPFSWCCCLLIVLAILMFLPLLILL